MERAIESIQRVEIGQTEREGGEGKRGGGGGGILSLVVNSVLNMSDVNLAGYDY